MKIVFTEYTRRQLEERALPEREIRKTLQNPEKTMRQPDGRYRAVHRINRVSRRYVLVVVYEKQQTDARVVTAFLTSKINKYL